MTTTVIIIAATLVGAMVGLVIVWVSE